MSTRRAPFALGELEVRPGRRGSVELPLGRLVTGTPLSLPVLVLHGREPGPTIWINAAIHGDEINGVEIIRRVLERLDTKALRGTIIAVPIVNLHGFMTGDRYLPDRRDLNRSFPGSRRGSLAGRIAHLFMEEIVSKCSVGIDLHTGSAHRTNLPQIRADLTDPTTEALAEAFGAPVMLHAAIRDGSLRQAAGDAGAVVLLYEGGEAWRFDETAIRFGVDGTLRVLGALDMIDPVPPAGAPSKRSTGSKWVRANHSGIAQIAVELGQPVAAGQPLGRIHDSFGKRLGQIKSPLDGVVIGMNLDPLLNRGDAVVHVAGITDEPAERPAP